MDERFDLVELVAFATALLEKAGVSSEMASATAEVLAEGDLMGHTTHGLQLLSPYLKSIEAGQMTLSGEPEVIRDVGSNLTWDGRYLPGPWLVRKAIQSVEKRSEEFGVATAVIRRSHHIGCLQAYLKPVTDMGRMILLTCSDPSVASVAPHGGLKAVYTPNPLAAGIPTEGDPVLIDISMSTTSNGRTMRHHKKGEKLPGEWVKSADGEVTRDPAVLFTDPPGTVLPLGGADLGYKGFALGLLVEALTSALGGHGRADDPDSWGASVFIQIIDPSMFGGRDAFLRETSWFVQSCHESPVPAGDSRVRVPGEAGLKRRQDQMENGVSLHPGIMDSLLKWGEKLGVAY